jgi:alpha-amylase
MQKQAFQKYAMLEPYVKAISGWALRLWRLLGVSDHFYYMTTKTGSEGEVHSYFSPYKSPYAAFEAYIEAITMLYAFVAEEISKKPTLYIPRIRLPKGLAFHFYLPGGVYLGVYARSIREFIDKARSVPPEPIAYHLRRGNIQFWLRSQFFLGDLVDKLDRIAREKSDARKLRDRVLGLLVSIL